ncbi:hypothetical protein KAFR_0B04010 [Kazachstania africana CBS 2517]|uniref:Rhodanese domain-containing protein n=1 Tax=Kazachstania africana (strain ATCC 22294 / BCRC 22015 / CBS 2517 / CECT 1963 / NBRC 1671 / NRRL Y-8276) TaxID=1071382 RepID=H2AQP7_KAZAF|nr:hypothetical protein KAFR_0B04010 [Kazachstania africana CBS 2517]CCF56697.1 hypothetical protein KAFR_0B04010 [Kazachstania africana CBS 2517]
MDSRSIADVKYLEPSDLYDWITQGHSSPFQVIDVRGSDYIGGHIINCWNYPYKKLTRDDAGLDDLKKNLLKLTQGTDTTINVVFHCAQSQQRGPSAAVKFLRSLNEKELSVFHIWILRGGFNKWQDVYGEDHLVTEGYEPALWAW